MPTLKPKLDRQGVSYWQTMFPDGRLRDHYTGEEIVRQGHRCNQLILVVQGFAKQVFVDETGKECLVALKTPGDWINLDGLMASQPNETSCLALCPVRTFQCDNHSCLSILCDGSDARAKLVDAICSESRDRMRWLTEAKTMCASDRLIQFIARWGELVDYDTASGNGQFHSPLKDHEVAMLLGVSKQHFSLLKKNLSPAGIAVRSNRVLVISAEPCLRILTLRGEQQMAAHVGYGG